MERFKKLLFLLLLVLILQGCNEDSNTEAEIERIPVSFELIRFDRVFAETRIQDLPQVKKQYPMFFPSQYPDSVWQQRLTDTLQQQLNEAVYSAFPEENTLMEDLGSLFQHISYYFPSFKPPKVYTVTSDVDYRTKVVATDSLLILELDTYLGADHPFYEGIPRYISQNLQPDQLIPDVAAIYARQLVMPPSGRSLLDQMVYYGKILYLKDLWLPDLDDATKIGYTAADLQWAKDNEEEVWRYFVEQEYLYSTQAKLSQRFIEPAPFSKFNLEIDNASPGRIGQWMGWQIVRAYMDNNPVSPKQLLFESADEIFAASKYKPKK